MARWSDILFDNKGTYQLVYIVAFTLGSVCGGIYNLPPGLPFFSPTCVFLLIHTEKKTRMLSSTYQPLVISGCCGCVSVKQLLQITSVNTECPGS